MNKVFLIGNIVRNIDVKQAGGYQVVQNSIAVRRNYPDKDGNYPTDFIEFQSWGKQAEYLNKYGAKGCKLAIVGKLQSREYDGRDGTRKTVWEVVTDEVQLLSSVQQQPKPEPKPQDFNVDPFREYDKTVDKEIKKEEPKVSFDDLPF